MFGDDRKGFSSERNRFGDDMKRFGSERMRFGDNRNRFGDYTFNLIIYLTSRR